MAEAAIHTSSLSKVFGGREAVSGLDLEVPEGSVFGFLGVNGAGKTTTIRMLLGLMKPSSGSAHVLGMEVGRYGPQIRQRVGYLPESRSFYGYMTVEETVSFCKRLYHRWDSPLVRRHFEQFGLPRAQRVSSLSRGQKTQLALILALASRPDLLILDEPTAGLDPVRRREFLTTVLAEATGAGQTVFMSSHNLLDVERVCDRVGLIHAGRLLATRPLDELKQNEKRLRVVFQHQPPAGIFDHPGIASVSREERGYLVTVSSDLDEVMDRLRAVPHFVLEVYDQSLEDVFLRYATEQGLPAHAFPRGRDTDD